MRARDVIRMRCDDAGKAANEELRRAILALVPSMRAAIAVDVLRTLEAGDFRPGFESARGRLIVKRVAKSIETDLPVAASILRRRAWAHEDAERAKRGQPALVREAQS